MIITGSAGMIQSGWTPCVGNTFLASNQTQVKPGQQLNVTFTDLPSAVVPPFNCRLPANASAQINTTWFVYTVNPITSMLVNNGTTNLVGDSFIFSVVQSAPGVQTNPYWVSANFSVTNSTQSSAVRAERVPAGWWSQVGGLLMILVLLPALLS
ncbi:hypothetical protein EHS25_007751 [Saitozyma podzolica]|uniref:Uncharacterized protein n=1 Tax=Saitozyma podzolica TaxID=1890683 RepID=A0A427YQP9_9TREE|nr:hypothetical protein EHS25_007751 [Saitozyma podzolica]